MISGNGAKRCFARTGWQTIFDARGWAVERGANEGLKRYLFLINSTLIVSTIIVPAMDERIPKTKLMKSIESSPFGMILFMFSL